MLQVASRVLVVLVVGGAMAAFDHEEAPPSSLPASEPGSSSDPAATPVAQPPTTWTPAEADCTRSPYVFPLTVTTTVEAELPYLRNVVACASDEQYGPVWLHNTGKEVWTLPRGPEVEWAASSAKASFLDDLLDEVVLVPGDEAVVHAPPSAVSWELAPSETVAWEVQEEALAQLQARGQAAVVGALDRRSPSGAALSACVLAGYSTARTWRDDPDGLSDNLAAALGSGAGATGCAAQTQKAWGSSFTTTATFLDDADSGFRLWSRLGRVLMVVR